MSGFAGSNLYSQGYGTTSSNAFPGNAVVQSRAPAPTDIRGTIGSYSVGQLWVDTVDNTSYQLTSFTSSGGQIAANWTLLGTLADVGVLSINNILPTGAGNFTLTAGSNITITPGTNSVTIASSDTESSINSIVVQTGTSPVLPNGSGQITFNGSAVAAGTTPITTNGTGANTVALQVQLSQAAASSSATKAGLASFNSTDFTVDANGYVSALTSSNISSGTWTPALEFGNLSTGITYIFQTGSYVAIGTPGTGNAIVFASLLIGLSSKGSATGDATIVGLPFSLFGGTPIATAPIHDVTAINVPANYAGSYGFMNAGPTSINLFFAPASGSSSGTSMLDTSFNNNSGIAFSIIYQS